MHQANPNCLNVALVNGLNVTSVNGRFELREEEEAGPASGFEPDALSLAARVLSCT